MPSPLPQSYPLECGLNALLKGRSTVFCKQAVVAQNDFSDFPSGIPLISFIEKDENTNLIA